MSAMSMLVLKATLLLMVAGVFSVLLRRASASVRHLVWMGGILSVLLLPVAASTVPEWHLLPAEEQVVRRDAGDAAAPPIELSSASSAAVQDAAPARAPLSRTQVLFAVWAIGAGLLLLRMAWCYGLVWWIGTHAERVNDDEWQERLARHAERLGVRSDVRLLRSGWTRMPMTWGFVKPSVVLPADAGSWSAERRDIVLLHELAHIRRRDALALAAAQLMRALHWFNPLAWMALHRLRVEAEHACDDDVLVAGMRASTYADHLLEIVRTVGRTPIPAAAVLPMARRKGFEGRLLAILEPTAPRGRVRFTHALGAVTLTLALLVGVAAASPTRATAIPIIITDVATQATDPDTDTGTAAAPAPEVVRELMTATVDVDAGVRVEAVKALAELADTAAARALIRALRTDSDAEVRRMAAWALGNMEYVGAVEALGEALRTDRSAEVQANAAWALGNIESDAGVDALVGALSNANAEVRSQAVWALGNIESPRAVEGLARLANDSDDEVREHVVWALGNIEATSAVPTLLRTLRDANASVRKQSAWALGQIESESALDGLTAALRDDSNAEVKQQAAWAIGQIEPGSAPRALLDAVKDPSVEVRRMVVWALSQIEDPAAASALREALQDADAEVRKHAIRALAEIGDDAAREALIEMLKSNDPEERRDAAAALGNGSWHISPKPQPQPRPRPRPGGGL